MHNRELSQIATQIEAGLNVTDRKRASLLVASWVLCKGKGGGFGKRMFSQLVRVLRGICDMPPYLEVRNYWHANILPPIHTCTEGTSQVYLLPTTKSVNLKNNFGIDVKIVI